MRETRHGPPALSRPASGHRRYSPSDCEAIERVLAERARGLSLQAAIGRVVSTSVEADPSLFATLRRAQPALLPQVLPKRALTALSRAIEDEICARADRPLLFAAFQRERFFRLPPSAVGASSRWKLPSWRSRSPTSSARACAPAACANCRSPATRRSVASGR